MHLWVSFESRILASAIFRRRRRSIKPAGELASSLLGAPSKAVADSLSLSLLVARSLRMVLSQYDLISKAAGLLGELSLTASPWPKLTFALSQLVSVPSALSWTPETLTASATLPVCSGICLVVALPSAVDRVRRETDPRRIVLEAAHPVSLGLPCAVVS